jgi:hypothetical protein
MKPIIIVERVKLESEHDNQKWLVLQASVEGCPEVTKRRSINTAALVDGSLTLAGEKAKLLADVEEYHARYLAVQEQLKSL